MGYTTSLLPHVQSLYAHYIASCEEDNPLIPHDIVTRLETLSLLCVKQDGKCPVHYISRYARL
jgi:hypothetical protein